MKVAVLGRRSVQSTNQNNMLHGNQNLGVGGFHQNMMPNGIPNGVHNGIPNAGQNFGHGQQHIM